MAQTEDDRAWARGLPLQDPLLADAILDVWRMAIPMGATALSDPRAPAELTTPSNDPPAPRDIQSARAMLDDAMEAVLTSIGRGERRGAGLLLELRRCAEQVAEASVAYRLHGTSSVYSALGRLRLMATERELIDAAPQELCRCGFDRVILTKIEGTEGVITQALDSWHPEWGAKVLRYLRQHPLKLDELPLEGEMFRRRSPLLVDHIRTDRAQLHPILELTDCRSYVAAPIAPQGRVIGFLHADTHHQRRHVGEWDRDRLWMFAVGLGQVYERRVLLDRIRALRQEVRRSNTAIVAVMNEYLTAPIELSPDPIDDGPMAQSAASMFVPQERAGSMLTRREREVMELVAAGHTNARIAAELVLSEQTVRSHVKRILRKLRAFNRAEAVSRWTSLGG